jgi:hypothetical protein
MLECRFDDFLKNRELFCIGNEAMIQAHRKSRGRSKSCDASMSGESADQSSSKEVGFSSSAFQISEHNYNPQFSPRTVPLPLQGVKKRNFRPMLASRTHDRSAYNFRIGLMLCLDEMARELHNSSQ